METWNEQGIKFPFILENVALENNKRVIAKQKGVQKERFTLKNRSTLTRSA